MSLLLTLEQAPAEKVFRDLIDKHREGPWVGLSACRFGAQFVNRKDWEKAAPFFEIAGAQVGEEDHRYMALSYQARSLRLAGKRKEARACYKKMAADPDSPFREHAQSELEKLEAGA